MLINLNTFFIEKKQILDRHISAKGQYNKKDLEQTVKKVDTIQGELNILPDPTSKFESVLFLKSIQNCNEKFLSFF